MEVDTKSTSSWWCQRPDGTVMEYRFHRQPGDAQFPGGYDIVELYTEDGRHVQTVCPKLSANASAYEAIYAIGLVYQPGTQLLSVCHCGKPVTGNGDEWQDAHLTRYCNDCRLVRCDAYPGACRADVGNRG